MSLIELSQRLGPDLTQYLNYDFFVESSDDYQRLCACVDRLAAPTDWIPDCNIHVYHGRDDAIVPKACSDELVTYLQSVGVDVDYVVTDGDHTGCGIAMATDLVKFLYK